MLKYWFIFVKELKKVFIEKKIIFFRATLSSVELLALVFLWIAVYKFKQSPIVSNFSLIHMVTYFLLLRILRSTFVDNTTKQILEQVRNGSIANYLVLPIDFILFYFIYQKTQLVL